LEDFILIILGIILIVIGTRSFFKFKSKPKMENGEQVPSKEHIVGKHFRFMEYAVGEQIPSNTWYRIQGWKRPNFLMMNTDCPTDWIVFIREEEVVGVTFDNRKDWFVLFGDYPGFKISLEREPENPVDPNAIKVIGSVTNDQGQLVEKQLGYISKDIAKVLKNYKMIDARPFSVLLPVGDGYFGLSITILLNRKELFKPIGNSEPICPYCNFNLEKMPGRKNACPNCNKPILVRTSLYDNAKVLVTEKQAEEIEEQYSKYNTIRH